MHRVLGLFLFSAALAAGAVADAELSNTRLLTEMLAGYALLAALACSALLVGKVPERRGVNGAAMVYTVALATAGVVWAVACRQFPRRIHNNLLAFSGIAIGSQAGLAIVWVRRLRRLQQTRRDATRVRAMQPNDTTDV